ncbi:uncharacterized protein LOC120999712 [Bufo bufo]|uniref:uncharacterized protein LOC120999712 n=1 Tax=Bufo bufo TaxID=8384 RepID=UPI001ABE9569|nr:uncharacterized protein LOC120999712 [Bufo bufo]
MLPAHIILGFEILLLRARRRARERRRRQFRVHQMSLTRMRSGGPSELYHKLRSHPNKFLDYLRMSLESFDYLVQRIEATIQRQDSYYRRFIPPPEGLMVTLRFLVTGESFSSLHSQFGMGIPIVSSIITETCQALWDSLCEDFIPLPTTQQWLQIAEKFWDVCQFPNCAGALNGKRIRILKRSGSESECVSYKEYFSVVVMAVVDAQYRFLAVDVGACGRTNDSWLLEDLLNDSFGLPAPRPLPGTEGPPMPFVVVGDKDFQMCPNMIKPYSNRGLNFSKRIFNHRLTRARRIAESTFEILFRKWGILSTPRHLKRDTVDDIVQACVVLHNFLIMKKPLQDDLQSDDCGLQSSQNWDPRSTIAGNSMRHNFAEYFISKAGWVDWQDGIV